MCYKNFDIIVAPVQNDLGVKNIKKKVFVKKLPVSGGVIKIAHNMALKNIPYLFLPGR